MGDDLVKRLRNTPNWKREEYGDYKSAMVHYDRAPFEAADRIEELEAKLAKAINGLHQAASDLDGYIGRGFGDGCRELVAELKGQNDGS